MPPAPPASAGAAGADTGSAGAGAGASGRYSFFFFLPRLSPTAWPERRFSHENGVLILVCNVGRCTGGTKTSPERQLGALLPVMFAVCPGTIVPQFKHVEFQAFVFANLTKIQICLPFEKS